MNTDTFIYLATPYAHKTARMRQLRARAAARIAGHLLRSNFRVFSPIIHNHQLKISYLKDWTHMDWMAYDAPFMDMASSMMIGCLPGWELSHGVKSEKEEFELQNKPVLPYDPQSLFSRDEWNKLKDFQDGGVITQRVPLALGDRNDE